MLKTHSRSSIVRGTVGTSVLLLALAGCGGSSDVASVPVAAATGSPGANGRQGQGGFSAAELTEVQTCLKAAGITLPTPNGGVRASDGTPPSGTANGTPPADSVQPSNGARAGGGRGGGGMFQSTEVQAALKACGIAIPTGRGNRPSATATG